MGAHHDHPRRRPRVEVATLREPQGGYVNVTGSASLARALLADDLVDDLLLMIEPIVLGGG